MLKFKIDSTFFISSHQLLVISGDMLESDCKLLPHMKIEHPLLKDHLNVNGVEIPIFRSERKPCFTVKIKDHEQLKKLQTILIKNEIIELKSE